MTYQVRDGKQVVPTCPECGCRLDSPYFPEQYFHFVSGYGDSKDAKGHRCKYIAHHFMFKRGVAYVDTSTNWKVPNWNPI